MTANCCRLRNPAIGSDMERLIYKILTPDAEAQFAADGVLTPSGVDAADGYVHFSTAAQLSETLDKHYEGHGALIILAINAGACGDALRWEHSRGGDLFPHLYGQLTAALVAARFALTANRDGLDGFLKGGDA